jgi:hypothetical protein
LSKIPDPDIGRGMMISHHYEYNIEWRRTKSIVKVGWVAKFNFGGVLIWTLEVISMVLYNIRIAEGKGAT